MDISSLHAQLSTLRTTQDAAAILQSFIGQIEADAAIFASYIVGDPTLESYRFVLAAPKAFCDTYQSRYWFLNDPCILYSNSNSKPIRVSELPVSTAAQREILDEAASHGFRSAFVIPVHGPPSSSRAGVLFLGSRSADRFRTLEAVDAIRHHARLISLELYDFIAGVVRRELLDSADLKADDLTLLRLQRDGFQSKDMATSLGTTPNAIDARFTRLNRKLGVSNRRQAAELAAQYGLLD